MLFFFLFLSHLVNGLNMKFLWCGLHLLLESLFIIGPIWMNLFSNAIVVHCCLRYIVSTYFRGGQTKKKSNNYDEPHASPSSNGNSIHLSRTQPLPMKHFLFCCFVSLLLRGNWTKVGFGLMIALRKMMHAHIAMSDTWAITQWLDRNSFYLSSNILITRTFYFMPTSFAKS